MSHPSSSTYNIKKVSSAGIVDAEDNLATEEPLEIRLVYGDASRRQMKSISVTMRTPGHDRELAVGFLCTEGIISGLLDIMGFPDAKGAFRDNIVVVELNEDVIFDEGKLDRHFYTSSSCGVCGKASIEAVRTVTRKEDYPYDGITLPYQSFYRLPELLNSQQEVFRSTGGLNASALFDLDNNLLAIREDVGRHNALDKLIGATVLEGHTPLDKHILLLSGRASFELIQKAAAAGIIIVAAVGAPSSLAVQLANEFNITLVGFLRNERYNIYSGMHRVIV
jgi:FdhD protein